MKIIYTTFSLFLLLLNFISAQSPVISWETVYGGSSYDEIHDLKITADGDILLAGTSSSFPSGNKTSENKGSNDFWLIKTNTQGDTLWQKTIGGNDLDNLYSIESTADGGFLLGGASASGISGDKTEASLGGLDYWLVKIDANGNVLWDKTIGGSNTDHLFTAHETSDGGYILAGSSRSPISGDKTGQAFGFYDYWVVKLDINRNISWQSTIGGTDDDDLYNIHEISDGGFMLGGYSFSDADGNKVSSTYGGSDFWIVKLNASGVTQWEKVIGGDSFEFLYSFEPTTDDGYIMVGLSDSGISGNKTDSVVGSGDYWVVKINNAGEIQWQKTYGGTDLDEPYAIRQTANGGYIIIGSSESGISGDKTEANIEGIDLWVVRIDHFGNLLWEKSIDNSFDDFAWAIEETEDRGFIIGAYSGYFMAPGNDVDAFGEYDFWTIKLEGCTPVESAITPMNRCESYTDPCGTTYTTSGEYSYTLFNASSTGCDSIVNFYLTIDESYEIFIDAYLCEFDYYTTPDGSQITSDTMLTFNLFTTNDCDSIIHFNLMFMEVSPTTTLSEIACDQFTLPNGTTVMESGIYPQVYSNNVGCDSIVEIDLTILNSYFESAYLFVCDEITLPDGTVLNQDSTIIETYISSQGCDSTISVNYIISESVVNNTTIEACESYTDPSGQTWTESGTYTTVFPGSTANGCDSTFTLNLTLTNIDPSVTENGMTLTANEPNATYQWIDCNNNNNPITNATAQDFSPEVSGIYAVIITKGDCEKISTCINFTSVSVEDNAFKNALSFYPNPSNGMVYFKLDKNYSEVSVKVFSALGELVFAENHNSIKNLDLNLRGTSGFYIVQVQTTSGEQASFKILKL